MIEVSTSCRINRDQEAVDTFCQLNLFCFTLGYQLLIYLVLISRYLTFGLGVFKPPFNLRPGLHWIIWQIAKWVRCDMNRKLFVPPCTV